MKPLLLLDVDGVILLHQASSPSCMRTAHGWIDRDVAERLYELDGLFEIVWCTGWCDMANDVIGPMFGMNPLPFVPLTFDPTIQRFYDDGDERPVTNWKLLNVQEYLGDSTRPVAWLDDQIGQTDVKRWAQKRPNTKLVQTYAERGLTEREMRMLVEFSTEQRPGYGKPGGLRGRLGM